MNNRRPNILLIGYGSAGKRHAANLMSMGITPYVLTGHPDKRRVKFIKNLGRIRDKDITHCIISSATGRHLADLKSFIANGFPTETFGNDKDMLRVLIEKPVERGLSKAKEIAGIGRRRGVEIFVGYNLRFLDLFNRIQGFIKRKRDKIAIVEIVCGQDLRQWRPGRDISATYSAHRRMGGGVDLDLSHEIDYCLWLFGNKFRKSYLYRDKISQLDIKAPDVFRVGLNYRHFIADISLDYIRRPAERYINIVCRDGEGMRCNLLEADIGASYKKMMRAFLGMDKAGRKKLCSIGEGLDVMKVLEI